jgi:hypothetical protein
MSHLAADQHRLTPIENKLLISRLSPFIRGQYIFQHRARKLVQNGSAPLCASEAGVTLIEVLLAVTLLGLLAVGMLAAIRMGFDTMHKTDNRLMENRRVAGAQHLVEQELAGFMPVRASCTPTPDAPGTPFSFFEGQPLSARMVSTYSLQEAWRGQPRILEYQVIPGDEGRGVRLIVNEFPYTGPVAVGQACLGMMADPNTGLQVPQFRPIQVGPQSFVLADKLAWCRFSYLVPAKPPNDEFWVTKWVFDAWPAGIRVDMAPLDDNRTRLRPLSITAAIAINRNPETEYVDK